MKLIFKINFKLINHVIIFTANLDLRVMKIIYSRSDLSQSLQNIDIRSHSRITCIERQRFVLRDRSTSFRVKSEVRDCAYFIEEAISIIICFLKMTV